MIKHNFIKRGLVLCVAAFICVFGFACTSVDTPNDVEKKSNSDSSLDFTTDDKSNASENTNSDNLNEIGKEIPLPVVGLDPTKIYKRNEKITVDGLTFSDFSVLSIDEKLMDGVSKDVLFYFEEKTDENGTLQDGNVYIFAKMSIGNDTSESREYYFPSNGFMVTDENRIDIASASEPRYISSKSKAGETPKDLYCIKLKPGEKKEITFAYILDKASIESGTLYFAVAGGGASEDMEYLDELVFEAF